MAQPRYELSNGYSPAECREAGCTLEYELESRDSNYCVLFHNGEKVPGRVDVRRPSPTFTGKIIAAFQKAHRMATLYANPAIREF